MDLYQKKNNVSSERNQRYNDKTDETTSNPPRRYKKIQVRDNTQDSQENMRNTGGEAEDISGNDNQRNKIKYVINLGKYKENENLEPEQKELHPNRSAIIEQNTRERNRPYVKKERFKDIPNIKLSKISREPQFSANNSRYNTINDISNITPNEKYDVNFVPKKVSRGRVPKKYNERYNEDNIDYYNNNPEFEISSMNDDDRNQIKNVRSPEPKIPPRIANILINRYKEEERKLYFPDNMNRSRNIEENPRLRKQRLTDKNAGEQIDDLIQIIEDLKSNISDLKDQIRNLKLDNIKKDKKIKNLDNDLYNMKKELEDKKNEQEKEIEDIFRSDTEENLPKLKNAYAKLLQDYDTNINDYNNLKDDYNKIVDEYNILKNSKKDITDKANKALDDYNNIVEDYNKLDKDYKKNKNNLDQLKNENDRLKRDNDRLRTRSKPKQPENKKEEDFNKLNDDYKKIKDDYDDLNNEYEKLKDENTKLRKDNDEISPQNKDEEYDRLLDGYNNLKNDYDKLQKENEELKNELNNNDAKEDNNVSTERKLEEDYNK